MRIDLHGNIKSVGPVWFARQKIARGLPLQRAAAAEDDEPWRYGRGWAVRLPVIGLLMAGLWKPTPDEDLDKIREDVASSDVIKQTYRRPDEPAYL